MTSALKAISLITVVNGFGGTDLFDHLSVIELMTQNTNIMVLSAGRRVELLQAFQEAVSAHLPMASVYAADLCPELSAACQVAHRSFKAPRVTSAGYIDFLIETCNENHIGMLVPTIDDELLGLSEVRTYFESEGTYVLVSDPALVAACRDKRMTGKVYDVLGIDQPEVYSRTMPKIPCFCKPYDGSSGIGAIPILSERDLTERVIANEKNMFMELIGEEYREFTVDCYYDRHGVLKCLVPRERIEVRSGEVSKGITRKHFVYDYLIERLKRLDGARGCITVQVFGNPETQCVKALEINPRFGGGYPLAQAAGANFPDWLIREYFLGETIDFFETWEESLLMLRYDTKVIVRENEAV